jgi:hypothetical protein
MVSYLDYMDGSTLRPKPVRYEALKSPTFEVARPSALERFKGYLVERENQKADAAQGRVARRLESLGDEWRVLDLQAAAGSERMSFLTLGPGGIFAVTVKDHGRTRISFAGDVVQIAGRRPKYVQEARRNADLASAALSRAAGFSIPVKAVLAFQGSGMISAYGLPKGVIITSYGELARVLNTGGRRLAHGTVGKLYKLAADPGTWTGTPDLGLVAKYKWHPNGNGSAIKGSADKGADAG